MDDLGWLVCIVAFLGLFPLVALVVSLVSNSSLKAKLQELERRISDLHGAVADLQMRAFKHSQASAEANDPAPVKPAERGTKTAQPLAESPNPMVITTRAKATRVVSEPPAPSAAHDSDKTPLETVLHQEGISTALNEQLAAEQLKTTVKMGSVPPSGVLQPAAGEPTAGQASVGDTLTPQSPRPENLHPGAATESGVHERDVHEGSMHEGGVRPTSVRPASMHPGDTSQVSEHLRQGSPSSGASAPPPSNVSVQGGSPSQPPVSASFDWERWLGVRGAAVVGGAMLALAGILFFKYSIEHGLIPPWLRVVIGAALGTVCFAFSERLRKTYVATANALAGSGTVLLYASFWAAKVLYSLIGMEAAFALMALTTVAACVVAVRHATLTVALFALIGGFATPLLLASGSDRPVGLFGYILLLDAGFLWIAHRRRWSSIALLCLLGTALIEGLWVAMRMTPERMTLALCIVGVFAVVFAVAGYRPPQTHRKSWLATQGAGLLLPYAFALYFAYHVRPSGHVYPIAILLAFLCGAANFMARRMQPQAPWLAIGSASATIAVGTAWIFNRAPHDGFAWEVVGCLIGLAFTFHAFLEWDRKQQQSSLDAASIIVTCGAFVLAILGCAESSITPLWAWLVGYVVFAGLLYRHASLIDHAYLQVVAAALLTFGFVTLRPLGYDPQTQVPYFAALALTSVSLLGTALYRRNEPSFDLAAHAGALFPGLTLLLSLTPSWVTLQSPGVLLSTTAFLALVGTLAATLIGHAAWVFALEIALAAFYALWVTGYTSDASISTAHTQVATLIGVLATLFFSAWTFGISKLRVHRSALYGSALAPVLFFVPLLFLYRLWPGVFTQGALPIALGFLTVLNMQRALNVYPQSHALRHTSVVWFAAVALGFVSVAIPLQLDKGWITIGWALEGAALITLFRRLNHPGLKWLAFALQLTVTVRLIANPYVLEYYERGQWRIVNWVMYTYLVPAIAMFVTGYLLGPVESARARSFESFLYKKPVAWIAGILSLCGLLVVFAWINLTIADWFGRGSELTLDFERQPAKDLTTSIAWAIYAVLLLAIGMVRRSRAMRWVSLIFLLVTLGKVFLYDLGQLRDLYRVMSLVGLALSLIGVSLAYQRFVFRKPQENRKP